MPKAFRLARVLRLRSQLRQQAQEQVGQILAAIAAARREAAALRRQAEAERAREEAVLMEGMTADALRERRAFEATLAARETQLGQAVSQMTVSLAQAREVVAARRREERQLERLAEQARERHQADEMHADAELLDELVLARRASGGRGRN
jgi:flagellar export protein FliJ